MKKTVCCLFIGSLMALSGVHASQETDWYQETEKLQNLGETLGFSNKTSHTEEEEEDYYERVHYNSDKNHLQTLSHLTRGLLEVLFLERAWGELDEFATSFEREFKAGQQILALADGTLNRCCSSLGKIDLRGNSKSLGKTLEEMTSFVKKALKKFENYKQQLHGRFYFHVPSKEYEVSYKVQSLLGSTEAALLWSVQKIDEAFQQLQSGQQINGETLQQEVHQILERYSIENL